MLQVVCYILHHGGNRSALRIGLFAVRGIRNEKPGGGCWFCLTGVALLKGESTVVKQRTQSRLAGIFTGFFNDDGTDVACGDRHLGGTVDGGEEKTIMDGYDLMMVEKDGAYYVLG